jgi:hypothetical protein
VSITHLYGLEERQDHRVHVAPEYRIHHPLLEMLALDAGDGSVVLHPEEDHAALKVGQRDDLLGECSGRTSSRLNSTPELSPFLINSSRSVFGMPVSFQSEP